MSRLIDADDLKNVFEGYSCTENPNPHFPLDMVKKDIDKAPPVEAVPVVHGEWIDFYGDYSTAECDQCTECYEVSPDSEPKKEYFEAFKQCYNFCPNCGADMRKKV